MYWFCLRIYSDNEKEWNFDEMCATRDFFGWNLKGIISGDTLEAWCLILELSNSACAFGLSFSLPVFNWLARTWIHFLFRIVFHYIAYLTSSLPIEAVISKFALMFSDRKNPSSADWWDMGWRELGSLANADTMDIQGKWYWCNLLTSILWPRPICRPDFFTASHVERFAHVKFSLHIFLNYWYADDLP